MQEDSATVNGPPRPLPTDRDAITDLPLHPTKHVCITSPDGTANLFYNTSTLIKIGADRGGVMMQPPHFREAMSLDLFKEVERAEGKKIRFSSEVVGALQQARERINQQLMEDLLAYEGRNVGGANFHNSAAASGAAPRRGEAPEVEHRSAQFPLFMRGYETVNRADVYICPQCFEHLVEKTSRRLREIREQQHQQAVQDLEAEEGTAHFHHQSAGTAATASSTPSRQSNTAATAAASSGPQLVRAPIFEADKRPYDPQDILATVHPTLQLPLMVFRRAADWRKHLKLHGEVSEGLAAADNTLRAYINRFLSKLNIQYQNRRQFDKGHSTTMWYWRLGAYYNVWRFNRTIEICEEVINEGGGGARGNHGNYLLGYREVRTPPPASDESSDSTSGSDSDDASQSQSNQLPVTDVDDVLGINEADGHGARRKKGQKETKKKNEDEEVVQVFSNYNGFFGDTQPTDEPSGHDGASGTSPTSRADFYAPYLETPDGYKVVNTNRPQQYLGRAELAELVAFDDIETFYEDATLEASYKKKGKAASGKKGGKAKKAAEDAFIVDDDYESSTASSSAASDDGSTSSSSSDSSSDTSSSGSSLGKRKGKKTAKKKPPPVKNEADKSSRKNGRDRTLEAFGIMGFNEPGALEAYEGGGLTTRRRARSVDSDDADAKGNTPSANRGGGKLLQRHVGVDVNSDDDFEKEEDARARQAAANTAVRALEEAEAERRKERRRRKAEEAEALATIKQEQATKAASEAARKKKHSVSALLLDDDDDNPLTAEQLALLASTPKVETAVNNPPTSQQNLSGGAHQPVKKEADLSSIIQQVLVASGQTNALSQLTSGERRYQERLQEHEAGQRKRGRDDGEYQGHHVSTDEDETDSDYEDEEEQDNEQAAPAKIAATKTPTSQRQARPSSGSSTTSSGSTSSDDTSDSDNSKSSSDSSDDEKSTKKKQQALHPFFSENTKEGQRDRRMGRDDKASKLSRTEQQFLDQEDRRIEARRLRQDRMVGGGSGSMIREVPRSALEGAAARQNFFGAAALTTSSATAEPTRGVAQPASASRRAEADDDFEVLFSANRKPATAKSAQMLTPADRLRHPAVLNAPNPLDLMMGRTSSGGLRTTGSSSNNTSGRTPVTPVNRYQSQAPQFSSFERPPRSTTAVVASPASNANATGTAASTRSPSRKIIVPVDEEQPAIVPRTSTRVLPPITILRVKQVPPLPTRPLSAPSAPTTTTASKPSSSAATTILLDED